MQVDKNSPVPLYPQLETIIRSAIESGQLKPGDRAPSEWELTRQYEVSRMTARQALVKLVTEGYLFRQHGKGTFVAHSKIDQQLTTMIGFTAKMRAQGLRVETQVLSNQVIEPSRKIAERLSLPAGELVIELKRLRLVEGEPAVIHTSYLPLSRCSALLTAELESTSLLQVLEEQCGLRAVSSRDTVEPMVAGPEEARLLKVPTGTAVLLLSGVLFDQTGTPIRLGQGIYRGDKFRFSVENYQLVSTRV